LLACTPWAQNLVPNPSFEAGTCPTDQGQIGFCNPWGMPTGTDASSDYYHACSSPIPSGFSTPANAGGFQVPATGSGYAGIYLLSNASDSYPVREYLMAPLTSTLVAGQNYTVSLKVVMANFTNSAVNSLGVYFSSGPLPYSSNYPTLSANIPVTPQHTFPQILSDTLNWTTLSFVYTATGTENYITVGVFADDSEMIIIPNNPNLFYKLSYAFVDDISVARELFPVTGDAVICAGQQATITAGGQTGYAWATSTAPTTIIGNGPSITVSPTDTTTYYVYAGNDTATFTVYVKPTPIVNLGNDTTICAGDNLLLVAYQGNAFVSGTQYVWQNGATGPFFTPTQSGVYHVTATLNGCVERDTVNVLFAPTPDVDFGPDRQLCNGTTLTLDATTTNATYLWQDNSTASTYTVTQPGTYSVTVTVGDCTDSDEITITAAPNPTVNLGNDVAVCTGTPVTLDATTQNATYQWQDNSTGATFSPTQSGTYWVRVNLGPCSAADSVNVLFRPLPAVNLGNDLTPCTGTTVTLDATQPGVTYNWQDDSNQATYTVTQSGTYTVQVTDANGCKGSDAVKVTFIVAPMFDFVDSTLCVGDTWILDIAAPYATYLWQDKTVQSAYTITREGTYWATATNACGSHSDTTEIKYRRCNCHIFVPNSFTPDQSLGNEVFNPVPDPECKLDSYIFTVFNRWGEVVFESQNAEFGWNGKSNGLDSPCDVYAYRILYKFDKTSQQRVWGSIMLVR